MRATGGTRQSATVPAALVRDLTAELSRRLWDRHPVTADAPEIATALACCEDPVARGRLRRFVAGLEQLPENARHDFGVALHPVQVDSKLWLISELQRVQELASSSLVVLGAWYGILPLLVNWRVASPPDRMVCVDIDPGVSELGERLIGALFDNLEYRRGDVMANDGAVPGNADVLVNTICEHLPRLTTWWDRVPAGQLSVLQTNNYTRCPDHVNCVDSIDEFKRQTPLSEVVFEGVMRFSDLDRYMLIGYR